MTEIKLIKTESGEFLTRRQVIDRLCQYDVYLMMWRINQQDYDWLSDTRERGFKGYANYTDDELEKEWADSEDGWNGMIADEEQPYELVSTFDGKPKRY